VGEQRAASVPERLSGRAAFLPAMLQYYFAYFGLLWTTIFLAVIASPYGTGSGQFPTLLGLAGMGAFIGCRIAAKRWKTLWASERGLHVGDPDDPKRLIPWREVERLQLEASRRIEVRLRSRVRLGGRNLATTSPWRRTARETIARAQTALARASAERTSGGASEESDAESSDVVLAAAFRRRLVGGGASAIGHAICIGVMWAMIWAPLGLVLACAGIAMGAMRLAQARRAYAMAVREDGVVLRRIGFDRFVPWKAVARVAMGPGVVRLRRLLVKDERDVFVRGAVPEDRAASESCFVVIEASAADVEPVRAVVPFADAEGARAAYAKLETAWRAAQLRAKHGAFR